MASTPRRPFTPPPTNPNQKESSNSSPFWSRVFPWNNSNLVQSPFKLNNSQSAAATANQSQIRRVQSHAMLGLAQHVATPKRPTSSLLNLIPPAAEESNVISSASSAAPHRFASQTNDSNQQTTGNNPSHRSPSIAAKDEFFSPRNSPTSSFCGSINRSGFDDSDMLAHDNDDKTVESNTNNDHDLFNLFDVPRPSLDTLELDEADSPFLATSSSASDSTGFPLSYSSPSPLPDSFDVVSTPKVAPGNRDVSSTASTPRIAAATGLNTVAQMRFTSLSRMGTPNHAAGTSPRYKPVVTDVFGKQAADDDSVLVRFASPVNGRAESMRRPKSVAAPGSLEWTSAAANLARFHMPLDSGSANENSKPAPSDVMLDLHSVFSTPRSAPKYSDRDIDAARREVKEKFEKEFDVLQMEIRDANLAKDAAERGKRELEKTLSEWEAFVKDVIAKKETEDLAHAHALATLKSENSALVKDNIEKDEQVRELRDRVRAVRMDLEDEREKVLALEKGKEKEAVEKAEAVERFEALRIHAEERIESANVEIARVRAAHEKEVAALKVKLSRLEVHAKGLEKAVEGKEVENRELTKICDDLLVQIEGRG